MGEIRHVKVQHHVCPSCGSTVLREVISSGDQPEDERTAGYVCAARCGWEIRGPSLPV